MASNGVQIVGAVLRPVAVIVLSMVVAYILVIQVRKAAAPPVVTQTTETEPELLPTPVETDTVLPVSPQGFLIGGYALRCKDGYTSVLLKIGATTPIGAEQVATDIKADGIRIYSMYGIPGVSLIVGAHQAAKIPVRPTGTRQVLFLPRYSNQHPEGWRFNEGDKVELCSPNGQPA